VIAQILGEALVIVVTAFMAEKASEKWKKPLWIFYVLLVFSLAGLQMHSWRADVREAEQREQKLKQKFDSVSAQLSESLLSQANMNGQLKSMQLIMGNLAQAGYPGMKEIASALTSLSQSNAQHNADLKASNKELCDRARAFAVKIREFESKYQTDTYSIGTERANPDLAGKTTEQRKAIMQQIYQQERSPGFKSTSSMNSSSAISLL